MAEAPERLIVALGPNRGVEYELGAGEFTIGRSTNNDIVLPLPEVSRRHARIWKARDGYYVEDLGSTNGTFVNDARVQEPALLVEGDLLQIGDSFRLLFTADPAGLDSDAQPVAGPETPDHAPDTPAPAAELHTPKPPADREPGTPEVVEVVPESPQNLRRMFFTCGCVTILLVAACFATLYFLDSYQGGQLLYCGGLNPFFELLLGPLGFNPMCP